MNQQTSDQQASNRQAINRQELALIQWECQQLLNRVTLLMDDAQWHDLAQCYTENATLYRPSDSTTGVQGREAILASFLARPPRTSGHLLANSVFDVVSANEVRAKSRIWLMTGKANELLPVKADSKLMVGTFVDHLVRVDDQWLIECRKGSLELTYTYE